MRTGKLVFTRITDRLPWHGFRRFVARHDGNRKIRTLIKADPGGFRQAASVFT